MAQGGNSRRRGRDAGGRRSADSPGAGRARGASADRTAGRTPPSKPSRAKAATAVPPQEAAEASGPFLLGVVPGATPGKWISTWRERQPAIPLELRHLSVREQRGPILDGSVTAALVRLPIDTRGLNVIALYDEVPVVMMSADSHLTAATDLSLDDLAGEIVIVPEDDVYGLDVPGAVPPSFPPPAETADAVATVAAGVGIVIVPMSLARLHQRKDIAHRPLRGGPSSTVALAWSDNRTTALVDTFVGIVRGRTAQSSRD